MFSSFSYRVLFQRFFPQNISLLPKIKTEAHANLKKKKSSCNTTLKHYAVMVKYTPLERSSLSSLICWPVVCFIYSSSKFIWALVHYYIVHIFPRRSIILWTKRRSGSPPGVLSTFFINNGRLHQLVWQGAITTT